MCRYYQPDSEVQILVTKLFNVWMKFRVPVLGSYYQDLSSMDQKDRDLIHKIVGVQKDLEILDMLFDDRNSYYNYRISRNNADIEVILNFSII